MTSSQRNTTPSERNQDVCCLCRGEICGENPVLVTKTKYRKRKIEQFIVHANCLRKCFHKRTPFLL